MSTRSLPVANLQLPRFRSVLDRLGVEQLAVSTKWTRRRCRKIRAFDLVLSFCTMAFDGGGSLLQLAVGVALSGICRPSRQGVWKRVNGQLVDLLCSLVERGMCEAADQAVCLLGGVLFSAFPEVFLQDSTCAHLPKSLADSFPGNGNKAGRSAVAKLDVLLELKSWRLARLLVKPFSSGDQLEAVPALAHMRAGALVIRDLGYFTTNSMEEVALSGCFFLTRLKFGVGIMLPDGSALELGSMLRKRNRLDLQVLVGSRKVPARLVAVPVGRALAEQRRRKAAQDRDRRVNHSQEYMRRLGWTLLLTNVDAETWTPGQAVQAYRHRWQIESMFKSWKSYLGVGGYPQALKDGRPEKFEAVVMAQLLLVVTVLMPILRLCHLRQRRQGLQVSISNLKLAMLIKMAVHANPEQQMWIEQNIEYYCKYDKRRRKNAVQVLMEPLS